MGVVFNIVCWVNVFQSFLSPLKSFRCCKNFASSLMFRYWKSFLILSVQQVFSFHSSFWFYEGIQQVLSSLVFLRQALKNDQAMIIFSSVIYCSSSLHLSFHTILCFFAITGHLTPVTWWSSLSVDSIQCFWHVNHHYNDAVILRCNWFFYQEFYTHNLFDWVSSFLVGCLIFRYMIIQFSPCSFYYTYCKNLS